MSLLKRGHDEPREREPVTRGACGSCLDWLDMVRTAMDMVRTASRLVNSTTAKRGCGVCGWSLEVRAPWRRDE